MSSPDAVKTGTIIKIEPSMKAGYIARDEDKEHVYFTFDDVVKDVGLGVAREQHRVQFIQSQDKANRLIAKQVTVMSAKLSAKRR